MPAVLVIDDWPGLSAIVGSGLGSSLFKLAACADLHDQGYTVDLASSPPKVELLRHASVFRECRASNELVSDTPYSHILCLGIPKPNGLDGSKLRGDFRSPPTVKQAYNEVGHIRYWRDYCRCHMGYAPPTSPARFPLDLATLGTALTSDLPELFVTLSLSAITHLKRYPHWHGVVDRLAQQHIPVVLVGMEKPRWQMPAGIYDLTRKTSISELLEVVNRSAVVAGTDGLVTNIAMVLGRPTVNLFTIIAPEFVIDDAQATRGPVVPLVHSDCPIQPCYAKMPNYRGVACPAMPDDLAFEPPMCTNFDPDRVVVAILGLLHDRGSKSGQARSGHRR